MQKILNYKAHEAKGSSTFKFQMICNFGYGFKHIYEHKNMKLPFRPNVRKQRVSYHLNTTLEQNEGLQRT